MVKMGLCCILIFFYLAVHAPAEENVLYPISDNDLLGYMNRQGETVIPAAYDDVELFSEEGFAVVGRRENINMLYGLIDREGNEVFPIQCDDLSGCNGVYRYRLHGNAKEGFINANNGFVQEAVFDYVHVYDSLVLVEKDGLYGFVKAENGEMVIPMIYDGLYDDVGESEGYVLVGYETGEKAGAPAFKLLDVEGNEVLFPEGIMPDSSVYEGVLRISRKLTDVEWQQKGSGWGMAYGLAKPDGTIVHEPEFDYVYEAMNGIICYLNDGLCGHMDVEGNVIVQAQYDTFSGVEIPGYSFHSDYALIEELDRYVVIDRQGNEVFTAEKLQGNTRFSVDWIDADNIAIYEVYPLEWMNGYLRQAGDSLYGLIKFENGQAVYITEPVFDMLYNSWGEKLRLSVVDGKGGFVNSEGKWVVEPCLDYTDGFKYGLAWVEIDGRFAYIDTEGTIVWQEK